MSEDATPQPDDAVPERFTVDFSGLTLLGNYTVERKLADGGMGCVYLGEDTNLGRKVVVKVPHVRFLGEAGFRRRFAREIAELVRLEHPHIVRILAQGVHDDVPFFVLQYLGGSSLETLLDGGAPIDIKSALPWFRRVAETLDFVHARNTIHRDVKPANILFDETGNVYLSDFGVAKALDNEDANLTDAGTGIGSPRYMPPEQGYGRELQPSADQYALAASLYETLSGSPPHGEGTAVELLVRKASQDAEPLASVVDHIPLAASDAIAKGMAREPSDRHESCRSFVDAVEQGFGLGTGEVLLPTQAAVEHVGRPWSKWFGIGLILLAAAVGFWALYDDEEPSPLRLDQAVTLLDEGVEPRRKLRYELGRREGPYHARVKQHVKTNFIVPDEDPRLVESDTVMRMHLPLRAKPVESGSEITWTLADIGVEIDSPNPLEQARAEALRSTIGSTASFLVDTFGSRLTMPPDEDEDELAKLRRESVGQFAYDILVPLPHEAVGVGARWEVAETVQIMGLRFLQTAIYELVAMDGPVLSLRATISQAAPSQELALPGMQKQRLASLLGGGSAEAQVRLDQMAPLRRHQSMQIKMAFERSDGGKVDIELDAEVWSGATPQAGD